MAGCPVCPPQCGLPCRGQEAIIAGSPIFQVRMAVQRSASSCSLVCLHPLSLQRYSIPSNPASGQDKTPGPPEVTCRGCPVLWDAGCGCGTGGKRGWRLNGGSKWLGHTARARLRIAVVVDDGSRAQRHRDLELLVQKCKAAAILRSPNLLPLVTVPNGEGTWAARCRGSGQGEAGLWDQLLAGGRVLPSRLCPWGGPPSFCSDLSEQKLCFLAPASHQQLWRGTAEPVGAVCKLKAPLVPVLGVMGINTPSLDGVSGSSRWQSLDLLLSFSQSR